MLFQPEGYEPLAGEWDEERARAGIRRIVADADAAFGAESLWPANDWDSWRTPTPLKMLYVGAAGVIWGLDALARRGYAESELDLAAAAESTVEAWRREPDLMAEVELPSRKESGLLSGESGILLVASLLTGRAELADDLYKRVRENEDSEAEDVMWGTPGTLVAARAMLEADGRRALARSVARRRRGALVAAGRRGLLDAAPVRRGVQGPAPAARAGRECPGAPAVARPRAPGTARAGHECAARAGGVPRGRARELGVRRTARAAVGGR